MNSQYAEALAEVDMILKIMPEEIIKKIPSSFYSYISNNKSNSFQSKAIDDIFIKENELIDETKDILSLIYRAYLCDEETKNKLEKQDYLELQQYNEKLNRKYSAENLFKKDRLKTNINEDVKEISLLELENEKWYKKILNRIKKLFFNK